VRLAEFEHVYRAEEIVVHDVAAAHLSIDPGEHARVGSGVEDPVDPWERLEQGGVPDVALHDMNAEPFQRFAIRLAARPDEAVDAGDLDSGGRLNERTGEGASNEATHARDQ
jgi:hypothetical protein